MRYAVASASGAKRSRASPTCYLYVCTRRQGIIHYLSAGITAGCHVKLMLSHFVLGDTISISWLFTVNQKISGRKMRHVLGGYSGVRTGRTKTKLNSMV
jgi:hypothetical protein